MKRGFVLGFLFLLVLLFMSNTVNGAASCIPLNFCHTERSVPTLQYYSFWDKVSLAPIGSTCPHLVYSGRGGTTYRFTDASKSTLGYFYSEPVGNSKPLVGCPSVWSQGTYYITSSPSQCIGKTKAECQATLSSGCVILGYYIVDPVSSSIGKNLDYCSSDTYVGFVFPNFWFPSVVNSCSDISAYYDSEYASNSVPFSKLGTIFANTANCNTYLNRGTEDCTDGSDNDYDTYVDCDDPDCEFPNHPSCPQTCTDNDGGLNYSIKGTTGKPGNTTMDSCKNSTTLKEYTCATTYNGYQENLYFCLYGCNSTEGICNAPPADIDEDGLLDGEEVNIYGTDPNDPDTDDDGLLDGEEISYGTNPNNPDSESDGMPDKWEVDNGLNPIVDDASEDPDSDELTNLEEYNGGTDPNILNCRDLDEDGHLGTPLGCGDDCNDNDNIVYTGAEEICDDGKDNNCNTLIDCADINSCLEACAGDIGVRGCRVEPMNSFWILQNDVEVEVNNTDCKLSLNGDELRCCPEGFSCTEFDGQDDCQCLSGGIVRCNDYSQTECESFDYSVAESSVENDLNKSDGFCGSEQSGNYVDCVCWWDGNSCEPQWEIINLDTNQSEGVCSVSGTQTECDDQGFKTLSYTVNQPAPIGCTAPSEIRTRCFVATEVPFFNLLSLVGVIGLLIVLYSIRKVL